MENHPIPQDVTGFQFRLIGNMTVKQFAYVAAGSVLAVIVYYAPLPLIFKLIFIPLFAGTGCALAFLPIEGRPLDDMAGYFLKDLLSPTQYIYHKMGGTLAISTIQIQQIKQTQQEIKEKKEKHDKKTEERAKSLSRFLQSSTPKHKTKLDAKEEIFLQAVFDPTIRTQLISLEEEQAHQLPPLPTEEAMRVKSAQSPEDMEHELEKEAEAIKKELQRARESEVQLEQAHQPVQAEHEHVEELNQQLKDILEQKQQLEQELLALKQQVAPRPIANKSAATPAEPLKASDNVRSVPSDKAQSIGLPELPDVPNIVIGIIKDPRGNLLSNILVEIKDTAGNPVRAFKTNGLGQFASATPLSRGSYTIDFEDLRGQHQFETVAIEANDEIMNPLEVISQDAREKLRQELFA